MSDQSIRVAPRRLPLLGHVSALMRRPMEFLDATRAYGDIVKIYLATVPAYLVHSPELIRRVLVTESNKFSTGRLFQKAQPIVGNGLLCTDGIFHRQQRRIMQPAFHRDRIAGYVDIMREEIENLTASWKPDQELAFDKEMIKLTLTVSAKALFSADVASNAVAEVRYLLPIVVKGVLLETIMPALWRKLPKSGHHRFSSASARLRTLLDDVILSYETAGVDHGDLLSMLLAARYEDSGKPMERQQVRDEAITVLLAATETTATALSWAFHALGQHKEVERQLRTELDIVLAGRPITATDVSTLEYTRRVLKETLRRHTPVWFLLKQALVPIDFDGLHIPAGGQVLYSPASVHRNPAFYSDPLLFDPDRWLPERADGIPRSAFIPFGVGSHQCIGESFAWTEMTVALATILARWRVFPRPGHQVREAVLTSLRPNALPMTVRFR